MSRFSLKFLNAVALLLVALGILLTVPAVLVLHPVLAAIAVALIASGFALGLPAGRKLGTRFFSNGSAGEVVAPPFDHVAATYDDNDPSRAGTSAYWAQHANDAWTQPRG